mgnify:CR=1 FL=1
MAINTRTAPFTAPGRLALLRVSGFPIIPAAILVGIAFVAIFAELIAPNNPEIGTLGDRFRPPFWQAGEAMPICSARTISAATCSPGSSSGRASR